MNLAVIAAIAYGALAIIGGIFGFVKSQSKISLISGVSSGIVLLATALLQLQGLDWAKLASLGVAAVLVVTFVIRLIKTQKFMPAGLMILAGVAAIAAMAIPA